MSQIDVRPFVEFVESYLPHILPLLGVGTTIAVVDTNVLVNDICAHVSRNGETGIAVALKSSMARVYSSLVVKAEVPEKLPIFAKRHNIRLEVLLGVWQTHYESNIHWLDTSQIPLSKPVAAMQAKDQDDVPLAQIIELLEPEVRLSTDKKHLAKHGFTVYTKKWTQVSAAFRDKTKSDETVVVVTSSGLMLTLVLVGVGTAMADRLKLAGGLLEVYLQKVQPWHIALLLVIAVLLLTHSKSRQTLSKVLEWLGKNATALRRLVLRMLEASGNELEHRGRFISFITEKTPPKRKRLTVRQYIGIVLSRANQPLSVDKLLAQMIKAGYTTRSNRPKRYVKRVLRQFHLLFEEDANRCWQLRVH